MTSDPNAPKIEFPCVDFPIKVIGSGEHDFQAQVVATLREMDVEFKDEGVRAAESRNARFVSLTIFIVAESAEQLSTLNTELRKLSAVKLVL